MTGDTTPVVMSGSYGREVYHTDPDCLRWPENPRPANDAELDELRECVVCAGDWNAESPGGGHYQSLVAASTADEFGGGEASGD